MQVSTKLTMTLSRAIRMSRRDVTLPTWLQAVQTTSSSTRPSKATQCHWTCQSIPKVPHSWSLLSNKAWLRSSTLCSGDKQIWTKETKMEIHHCIMPSHWDLKAALRCSLNQGPMRTSRITQGSCHGSCSTRPMTTCFDRWDGGR